MKKFISVGAGSLAALFLLTAGLSASQAGAQSTGFAGKANAVVNSQALSKALANTKLNRNTGGAFIGSTNLKNATALTSTECTSLGGKVETFIHMCVGRKTCAAQDDTGAWHYVCITATK